MNDSHQLTNHGLDTCQDQSQPNTKHEQNAFTNIPPPEAKAKHLDQGRDEIASRTKNIYIRDVNISF